MQAMRKVMPANSKIAQIFRDNVRARMESLDISVTDLAGGLGMSRPGLSRVLNGHDDLTLTRAAKIAAFLKADLPELLNSEKTRQTA